VYFHKGKGKILEEGRQPLLHLSPSPLKKRRIKEME